MDKSTIEIILLVIAIIIAIVVPIRLSKKDANHASELHDNSEKTVRINAVVTKYAELLKYQSSDIPALIQAGMTTLQSEEEAKEAVAQIANLQGQRSPLSSRESAIMEVGILRFFRNITLRQYQAGKMKEIIDKLRKNPSL